MARPIPCDLCGQEDAAILQSSTQDGSTVSVGYNCIPAFIIGFAQSVAMVAMPADQVPTEMGGTLVIEEPVGPPKSKVRSRREAAVVKRGDQADASDVTETDQ